MTVRSILVVNMNYLGDALMTTPAIRALRASFSTARIDVIAGSTANYGALEILALDPDIDRLIPRINGGSLARGKQLFSVIRKNDYDLVVILPSLPFYSAIAKLTGKRVWTVPKADESKHMVEHMLDSINALLNSDKVYTSMVMEVPSQAEEYSKCALGVLNPEKRLVLFNLGASRPQKRWPSMHFSRAAQLVVNEGFNLILLGGDNVQDVSSGEAVMGEMAKNNPECSLPVVNLVGKTTLEQLAAVIKRGDVLVTADTGAMHIACALETPVIALFGSTSAIFTGPYGDGTRTRILDLHLDCAPCITHPTCNGRFDCMVGITPDMLMQSILELMAVTGEIAACAKN